MATTFFLDDSAISATVTNWPSTTKKGLLLTRGGVAVSSGLSATTALLSATLTNGSVVEAWPGTTYALPASTAGGNINSSIVNVWITNPLSAVTVAGSITVNLRALEDNAMANYGVGAEIYRLSSGTLTRIGINNSTTELGTSEAARSFTISPTSTALASGDQLVIVPFFLAVGGAASGGFNSNCFWNGPTSAASGDTFVTFTETITEFVAVAAVIPNQNVLMAPYIPA